MKRIQHALTSQPERALLVFLCRRAPHWVTSDLLTWLGLAGATITFLAGCLANLNRAALVLAAAGLVINWLGDSMDGSLARQRGVERPQYGFFLDHTVDSFAMALIATGIGLSPMTHFWSAMLALISYYIMTVVTLTICLSTGVFKISFGRIGPTEVRIGIAGCAICAYALPIAHFTVLNEDITIYDAMLVAFSLGVLLMVLQETINTSRKLAIIDPPNYRKY